MSDTSTRLALPLIKPSQAQKHVTHNEALLVLDGLVQAALEETGAVTPPLEPEEGTLFALGASPTGDWAGEGGHLALRSGGGWLFLLPRDGWRAWDKSEELFKIYSNGSWAGIEPDLNNIEGVGIGTSFDPTNKLAVAADASLFSHDGAGHQVKVNKAADTDTASLLFQSDWTGHAEMGLSGDTEFAIKVSADGTTWQDALKVAPASGAVTFPNSVSITGGTISGITDLAVADGGTGASSAGAARTNLGLGSLATQSASAVNIDGGTIDGTAIGNSTPAAGAFTAGTFAGDLSCGGDGLYFRQSNGRLGIGTAYPSQNLQINGSVPSFRLLDTDGTNQYFDFFQENGGAYLDARNDTDNGFFVFRGRSASGAQIFATISKEGNLLVGGTASPASAEAALCLFNGSAPTTSVANGVALYAEDVANSSELKVRDEAGNITTLSPHNFTAIPEGASEPGAWAHYSEFDSPEGRKAINVDMLKLARLIEELTGETLVHTSPL